MLSPKWWTSRPAFRAITSWWSTSAAAATRTSSPWPSISAACEARLRAGLRALAGWRPRRRQALAGAAALLGLALAGFGILIATLDLAPAPRLPPPRLAEADPGPARRTPPAGALALPPAPLAEATLAPGPRVPLDLALMAPGFTGAWRSPVSSVRADHAWPHNTRFRRLAITRETIAKIALDPDTGGPYALILYFRKDRDDAGIVVLDCRFSHPDGAEAREAFVADLRRQILDKAWFATRWLPPGFEGVRCRIEA